MRLYFICHSSCVASNSLAGVCRTLFVIPNDPQGDAALSGVRCAHVAT